MFIVSKPEDWPLEYYPEVETPSENVLSHYAIIIEHDGGYLLFHTISWSLYYLAKEEYENLYDNEVFKYYKIVLDKSIDETPIAERVYLERSEYKGELTYNNINGCVIMTTSNCNARCGYCYEKGIVPIGMTIKTAEDAVQFIKNKRRKKTFRVRWFGGEPLLNTKVIDYICQRLVEEEIDFKSDIITNGYLADEENAKKFDEWRIGNAQITIDGIGEKYNEIKKYKGNDPNPFQKVIENIWHIIRFSTSEVTIRVNISEENVNDIDNIVSYLLNEFESEPRIRVYCRPIYQISNGPNIELSKEIRNKIDKEIEKYPRLNLFGEDGYILKKSYLRHCSSDIGTWAVINPQGKIGPCEHWNDNEVVGDIINGVTNKEKLEEWRIKGGDNISFCIKEKCEILPICEHYIKCESNSPCKSVLAKEYKIDDKKEEIIRTYEYWKKKYGERN